MHVSLGTGSVIGPELAPAMAGLTVLSRVASATVMSDRPAVATTADGAMAILAQDTLRTAHARARRGGPLSNRPPAACWAPRPTRTPPVSRPFWRRRASPSTSSTDPSAPKVRWWPTSASGGNAFVVGGSDDVHAQALLYATADHPLIGEEVFAGGAYLNAGVFHGASLRAQDVVRVLVILAILIGTLLRTLGIGL